MKGNVVPGIRKSGDKKKKLKKWCRKRRDETAISESSKLANAMRLDLEGESASDVSLSFEKFRSGKATNLESFEKN